MKKKYLKIVEIEDDDLEIGFEDKISDYSFVSEYWVIHKEDELYTSPSITIYNKEKSLVDVLTKAIVHMKNMNTIFHSPNFMNILNICTKYSQDNKNIIISLIGSSNFSNTHACRYIDCIEY